MTFDLLKFGAEQLFSFRRQLANSEFKEERTKIYSEFVRLIRTGTIEDKDIQWEFLKTLPKGSGLSFLEQGKHYTLYLRVPKFKSTYSLPKDYDCILQENFSFPPLKYNLELIFQKGTQSLSVIFEAQSFYDEVPRHSGILLFPVKGPLSRKIRKDLEPYTRHIVILDKNTTFEEVVLLVGLYALRSRFLSRKDESELYLLFRSYVIQHFRIASDSLTKMEKKAPRAGKYDEITSQAFNKIFQNFNRPYHSHSFNHYINRTLKGLKKTELAGGGRIPYLWKEDSEDVRDGGPTEGELKAERLRQKNRRDFQKFEVEDKVLFGVKRVALDYGISTDYIYRLIRKGEIRRKVFEDILVLDEEAINYIKEKLEVKRNRKDLITILKRKGIKHDSARKRVKRWENKGLSYAQMMEKLMEEGLIPEAISEQFRKLAK